MVRQHALMESLSANLHGFLHQTNGNLFRPYQKFIQDALIPPWRTPGGPPHRLPDGPATAQPANGVHHAGQTA